MHGLGRLAENGSMPTYQYDLAPEQSTPYPPVHQLRTIEADDPYDALRKIAALPPEVPPGASQVWIRVAVAYNPKDGSVRAALSVPIDASAAQPDV